MGLSIGDVEKITGISKDRIRYYEEKRLITPVRDTNNSYREYDNEEVLKLLGIQLYRSMDLGVKEIQQIQDSDSIEKICNVFKSRQEELQLQMAQLQYQKDIVSRSIDDCEKITDHLGKFTIKKVKPLRLIDKIDDLVSTEAGAKFRTESDEQMIIIRSFVRRIELTPEGIGENAVFVAEETGEEDEYWKTELPLQAEKLVAEQFDRIIIDEAQDVLNAAYLKLFDAALKKGIQRGKWSMYGDFSMQAIYASDQDVQFMLDTLEDMTSFVRFRLTVNCRNTREVCEAICTASGYRPPVKPWSRTSGPDVDRRSWKTPDEQYDKLASLLHELLQDGVAASGITILSPRKRENSVVARIQGISVRNYTVPPAADVTFSTIHRFKGMENQVIILTDIMDYADSRLIYVAMSRARSKLYILENENATHEYDTLVFRRMMEK